MSAKRSTQTRQARPGASRPSAANLQKENDALRQRLLAAQAELDENNEVEQFLRARLRDLNATIRVQRAQLEAHAKKDSTKAPAEPAAEGED